ncbi:MAG: DUF1573 domain-containing protein [Planctomycetes bacterium]|nr:DUF1573 domain-containing protein [Planctomycetota bacterium]
MRRYGALFFALGWLFLGMAEARAQLRFAEPVANLGEIRGGPTLQHSFAFTNSGSLPIEIIEVDRSCGCLAPRLDKRRLSPGEKGNLRMDIRTLGQPNGPHAWTAQVRYREDGKIQETPIAIKAVVKNEITVQPPALAFFVENTLRQEVIVADTGVNPFAIKQIHCSGPAKLTLKKLEAGKHQIIIEVRAADLAPGSAHEILNIYTDDPVYAQLEVPVTMTRIPRSAVLVSPEKVEVQIDKGQKSASTLVRLRPRGEESISINKVTWGDEITRCDWAKGPDQSATLKIRVEAAKAPDGVSQSHVRVDLSEPPGEMVLIPVSIRKE